MPAPSSAHRLAVPVLLLALSGGAVTALAAAKPSSTALVTLGGEQLAHPAKGARVIAERAAQGGRSMMLSGAVSLTAEITLRAPVDHLALRVRAKPCGGAPRLRVSVDRKVVVDRRVAFTRYRLLTVARKLGAGQHRIVVSMTHPRKHGGCARRLYVDTLRLTTTAKVGTGGSTTTASGSTPAAPAAGAPGTTTTTTTGSGSGSGSGGGAGASAGILRWAPPLLVAPTTVSVADGDQWLKLDTARDYIVRLPDGATHNGSLGIEGGRNVVVMGGHIRLPSTSSEEAALQLRGNAGTVHVEGVWIDGSSGYNADAIRIASPAATVQLENIRATGLRGSAGGSHTDVVQPYGGVADLRIDHLSGDSNYQGIFAKPDLGPIGSMELSDVDLAYDDVGDGGGGYMLWLTNGCTAPVTTLSNVYVKPSAAKRLSLSVWPNSYDANCPAKVSGNTVSWPKLPVTGWVTGGTPPGGPYATAATVGAGAYASPGYQ